MLNEDQQKAFEAVLEGKNVFISGPGGVGKSYLLNFIISKFKDDTVVMAPTGIAALNINGCTIHSAFKFPHQLLTKREAKSIKKGASELFDKHGPVKRIIIDEISMVRSDLLTAIDIQLREIRQTLTQPFGGLQVIASGDFYQLSPVLTDREADAFYSVYDNPFCFTTRAWSAANFSVIQLNQPMRQTDPVFLDHLSNIRVKSNEASKSVSFFNSIGKKNNESLLDNDTTYLCSTNRVADEINVSNYLSISDEDEHVYKGMVVGNFGNQFPTPQRLALKYGTKVVFTANTDTAKNGQTGYVVKLYNDSITVLLERDEREVLVQPYKWNASEYRVADDKVYASVIGSYTQLPVKLGWAVTIHKAQGTTLDSAVISSRNGMFCHGQLYVALSRIRTLEGMGILFPISLRDVIIDPLVNTFYAGGARGSTLEL